MRVMKVLKWWNWNFPYKEKSFMLCSIIWRDYIECAFLWKKKIHVLKQNRYIHAYAQWLGFLINGISLFKSYLMPKLPLYKNSSGKSFNHSSSDKVHIWLVPPITNLLALSKNPQLSCAIVSWICRECYSDWTFIMGHCLWEVSITFLHGIWFININGPYNYWLFGTYLPEITRPTVYLKG